MARPRKNPIPVALEEKEAAINKNIEDCQGEIEEIKNKIAKLKLELAEVAREKEEQALKELRDVISVSGKSVEDWLSTVKRELEK